MRIRIIEGKTNRHSLADNTLGPMMELARLVRPKRLKKVPSKPVKRMSQFQLDRFIMIARHRALLSYVPGGKISDNMV